MAFAYGKIYIIAYILIQIMTKNKEKLSFGFDSQYPRLERTLIRAMLNFKLPDDFDPEKDSWNKYSWQFTSVIRKSAKDFTSQRENINNYMKKLIKKGIVEERKNQPYKDNRRREHKMDKYRLKTDLNTFQILQIEDIVTEQSLNIASSNYFCLLQKKYGKNELIDVCEEIHQQMLDRIGKHIEEEQKKCNLIHSYATDVHRTVIKILEAKRKPKKTAVLTHR